MIFWYVLRFEDSVVLYFSLLCSLLLCNCIPFAVLAGQCWSRWHEGFIEPDNHSDYHNKFVLWNSSLTDDNCFLIIFQNIYSSIQGSNNHTEVTVLWRQNYIQTLPLLQRICMWWYEAGTLKDLCIALLLNVHFAWWSGDHTHYFRGVGAFTELCEQQNTLINFICWPDNLQNWIIVQINCETKVGQVTLWYRTLWNWGKSLYVGSFQRQFYWIVVDL
jgi:hypothetical protein